MKSNMSNKAIVKALMSSVFVLFLVGGLSLAPLAHAQFDGTSSDGGCACGGTGSYSLGTDYTYGADYSTPSYSTGTDYSYPADYSTPSYSTGTDYSYAPSYTTGGTSYPASSYTTGGGYSTGGYMTGGYLSGGYTTGGYLTGGSMPVGGGYTSSSVNAPTYDNGNTSNSYNPCATPNSCSTYDNGNTTAWNNGNTSTYAPTTNTTSTWDNGNTSTYAPTNTNTWDNGNVYAPTTDTTNTCTAGNSCNTNIVTTNNTSYSPPAIDVIQTPSTYSYPTPVCNTCGCAGYASCPIAYNPPVVPASAPYITLSQVPYTGLDLGFWGTIAYWGFLILWCLAAAYLIVVKRVQNRVYSSLKNFLFGSADETPAPAFAGNVSSALSQNDLQALAAMLRSGFGQSEVESAPAPMKNNSQEDTTDEFILSQINRSTR